MTIIAFYGPDGAGKTTTAILVARLLSMRDYRVSIIRLREHHLLMYLLIRFLQRTGLLPKTCSLRELDYKFISLIRKSLKVIIFLEWINAIAWIILNVGLRKMLGYVIVAERSIPDFIVSLRMLSLNTLNRDSLLIKILDNITYKTKSIYLYARPNILLKRKTKEKLTRDYINYLISEYTFLAVKYRSLSIDTSSTSPKDIVSKVIKYIANSAKQQKDSN